LDETVVVIRKLLEWMERKLIAPHSERESKLFCQLLSAGDESHICGREAHRIHGCLQRVSRRELLSDDLTCTHEWFTSHR
jgi:hypothetical protein